MFQWQSKVLGVVILMGVLSAPPDAHAIYTIHETEVTALRETCVVSVRKRHPKWTDKAIDGKCFCSARMLQVVFIDRSFDPSAKDLTPLRVQDYVQAFRELMSRAKSAGAAMAVRGAACLQDVQGN